MILTETSVRFILTALLWISWCAVHSILMCEGAARWTGVVRLGLDRYYRLIYCVVAIVTLILAVWLTPRQNEVVIWVWHGPLRIVQAGLWIGATIIAYKAFRLVGWAELLGLNALGFGKRSKARQDQLVTWGIYRRIRHPQFLAGVIIIWVHDLTDIGLVISTVLSLYLGAGVIIEERRLLGRFGDRYRVYMAEVPRFIPAYKPFFGHNEP